MVFRAFNSEDNKTYAKKQGIFGKEQAYNQQDAREMLLPHIKAGSRSKLGSCWISTSRSIRQAASYAYQNPDMTFNDTVGTIAMIDDTGINFPSDFEAFTTGMVDLSTQAAFNRVYDSGFLQSYYYEGQPPVGLEENFAVSAKEVLFYQHIPQERIRLLSPLETDILIAAEHHYQYYGETDNKRMLIDQIPELIRQREMRLTDSEAFLYNAFYSRRQGFKKMLQDTLLKDPGRSIIAEFVALRDQKSSMIQKLTGWLNASIMEKDYNVIEYAPDHLDTLRKAKLINSGNSTNINQTLLVQDKGSKAFDNYCLHKSQTKAIYFDNKKPGVKRLFEKKMIRNHVQPISHI